jgi:hypothetical protein
MTRTLFSLFVVLAFVLPLQARPAYKQAFSHYFGSHLPKQLNACVTCHLPDPPGAKEDADKPHNAFGLRLKSVKDELRKAGKSASIEARLDAILDDDADGDGASNLLEILTGHAPGDKSDRPGDKKLAEAKSKVVAFLRDRKGYPWRPFEVVKRPEVPKVKNAGWVRNPIDAFIAADHDALGLRPRPEADRAVLLRRVYLDLIGLPPTPAELHQFLKESSSAKPQAAEAAYASVVDELLARPQYGERWGRHWMDVWRYSDWAGYGPQVRDSQPYIWRWRDWIIDSLNEDKGYDRMVLEMLAGDELAPDDPKALAATGYLVRNFKLLSREKWMQDTVEHTFQAFQGVTIGCAKCHDHMFDPLLQLEYYQVRAIFEPHNVRTDKLPHEPDIKKDGLVRVYDKDPAAPTSFFVRGDDRTPDKNKKIVPGVPEFLGGRFPKIETIQLVTPERHAAAVKAMIADSAKDVEIAKAALVKDESNKALETTYAAKSAAHDALIKTLAAEKLEDDGKINSEAWKKAATEALLAQRVAAARQAELALREAEAKLAAATTGTPAETMATKALKAAKAVADKTTKESELPPSVNYKKRATSGHPPTSTGRRLAFAKWLAGEHNPLTARVAVNHIWLRHFGQAIVPSVFDFGKNGRAPSHPALLDWLAAELMNQEKETGRRGDKETGWSMKHVHRLIVTSATYRQSSTPDAANMQIDRDNKYLWRYAPHRLEAEAVRDAVFYVAGKLDLRRGGPDIDYKLGLTTPRRSLYFRHAAEKQMEFLQLFDAANVTECYERQHSIVPQQALALMNSDVALKHARILARTLAAKSSETSAFVGSAFDHVLSRTPTKEERAECVKFLAEQTKALQATTLAGANVADGSQPSDDPAQRARENLVHALFNHHEFVTIR